MPNSTAIRSCSTLRRGNSRPCFMPATRPISPRKSSTPTTRSRVFRHLRPGPEQVQLRLRNRRLQGPPLPGPHLPHTEVWLGISEVIELQSPAVQWGFYLPALQCRMCPRCWLPGLKNKDFRAQPVLVEKIVDYFRKALRRSLFLELVKPECHLSKT